VGAVPSLHFLRTRLRATSLQPEKRPTPPIFLSSAEPPGVSCCVDVDRAEPIAFTGSEEEQHDKTSR
jgi:hypothetical protein